jgi:hypothetical protein
MAGSQSGFYRQRFRILAIARANDCTNPDGLLAIELSFCQIGGVRERLHKKAELFLFVNAKTFGKEGPVFVLGR